jgi:spermidine synthase
MKFDAIKFNTRHTSLSIVRTANTLELRFGADSLQSRINIKNPHRLQLKNLKYLSAILMFLPAPQNILLLGTGGGSLVHFLRHHYPRSRLVSVDFDAELQELMHQKMLLPEANKNLQYVIDDAAHFIQHCEQQFDLILVDIFDGVQSPDWLLKVSCMRQMQKLLSDRGAIAYNLLIDSKYTFNSFYRDLTRVFEQQVLFLPVEGYDNILTYGFRVQPPKREISYYLQHASSMTEVHEINYNEIIATIFTSNPVGSGII